MIGRPSPNFNIPPDLVITGSDQLLPDDAGAIALYHGDRRNYSVGMEPTNIDLVDAIVYGSENTNSDKLLYILLPDQTQVIEDQKFMEGDESIVRCQCCQPLDSSVYEQDRPTPGYDNPCTLPEPPSSFEVSISEVGMKTHLFTTEYIELQGPANLALDDYFIVLYDKDGLVYFTEQLRNQIGESGFYLLGSPNMSPSPDINFLSRGVQNTIEEDGGVVALYYGTAGDFPKGSGATDRNLVDAIVYTASADEQVGGVDILMTEQWQFFADLNRSVKFDNTHV